MTGSMRVRAGSRALDVLARLLEHGRGVRIIRLSGRARLEGQSHGARRAYDLAAGGKVSAIGDVRARR